MSVLIAIVLALGAVVATPEVEAPQFIADIVLTCVPVHTEDFAGCELPVTAYAPDELGYAGWSAGEPVTGP